MLKGWRLWFLIAMVLVGGFWLKRKVFLSREDIKSGVIKRGTVREELVLSGKIKAVEQANLRFLSSGKLAWVGVKMGDRVEKGQALVKLDTASLYAQYEQAVADLRKAQATVDRVLDEVKDHDDDETLTQRETRTTAEANRDRAYRALEIAKKNLADGYIRAPFDGVISQVVFPFTGVNTAYTQSLIEIINPETMYFEVLADQTEVGGLDVGQRAVIILDPYLDEELSGTVTSVGYTPKIDEAGTVYEIRLELDELDIERIKVGMTGDARFILKEKQNALYVPIEFLNSDTKGSYLKVGRNDKVYVEVGLEGEELVEVVGEISEGDVIYD